MVLCRARTCTQWSLWFPSNSAYSVILWHYSVLIPSPKLQQEKRDTALFPYHILQGMDPGMQFQEGIATLPAEGIWRHLVLKLSTWICSLLDMKAPPRYSGFPEEALPWHLKAKVLHLCPVNFQAIQALWGKRKAHWYLTSWHKMALNPKITIIFFHHLCSRKKVALALNFFSMQINFQRNLRMFKAALGISLAATWEWSDRLQGGWRNKVVFWMFPLLLAISTVYSNVSSNLKAYQWKGFTRDCNKLFTQ